MNNIHANAPKLKNTSAPPPKRISGLWPKLVWHVNIAPIVSVPVKINPKVSSALSRSAFALQ